VIVQTVNGPRLFVTRKQMRETLAIEDEQNYKFAIELLIAERYLKPHRRKTSPAHGFVLGEGWSHEHVLWLRKAARGLLVDAGVHSGGARISVNLL
jgi:hypothetical protein